MSLLLSQQGGPKVATATFAGIGTLVAAAIKIVVASAVLVGAGTLSATPIRIKAASAAIAGRGTLAATGAVIHTGTAAFGGRGTLAAIPVRIAKDNAGGRRRVARATTIEPLALRLPAPILRARTIVLNPARIFFRDRLALPGWFCGSADAVSPVLLGVPVPQVSLRAGLTPPNLVAAVAAWPPIGLEDVMRLGLLDMILDV